MEREKEEIQCLKRRKMTGGKLTLKPIGPAKCLVQHVTHCGSVQRERSGILLVPFEKVRLWYDVGLCLVTSLCSLHKAVRKKEKAIRQFLS